MAKAESIPKANKVKKRSKHQKLGAGIVLIAAGKATKARPLEDNLSDTGEESPTRYPTTEKTEKPAKKEKLQLMAATATAFLMTGEFLGM